jgi:hypothetical protein
MRTLIDFRSLEARCHRQYRRDTRALLGPVGSSKTVARTVVVCQSWVMVLAESIVILDFFRHPPLIGRRKAKSMLT